MRSVIRHLSYQVGYMESVFAKGDEVVDRPSSAKWPDCTLLIRARGSLAFAWSSSQCAVSKHPGVFSPCEKSSPFRGNLEKKTSALSG